MFRTSRNQFCRLSQLLARPSNTNIKINKFTTNCHLLTKEDKGKSIFTGTWQFPENQNENVSNKIKTQFKKPLNKQVAEEIQNLSKPQKKDGKKQNSDKCLFDSKFGKGPEKSKGPKSPKGPKRPEGPKSPKRPKSPKEPKSPKGPERAEAPVGPKSPKGPERPEGPRKLMGPEGPKSPKELMRPEAAKGPRDQNDYYRWTPQQHEEWTDRLFGDLKELARQKKEEKTQGRNKTTESANSDAKESET